MLLTHDSEAWDHIVGIDPGITTGVYALRLGGASSDRLDLRVAGASVFPAQLTIGETRAGGRGGPVFIQEARFVRALAGRLVSLAEQWGVGCLHLAIESFTIRERSMDESLLSPVRLTSGLLAMMENFDTPVVVHFNSPGDAKSTVQDKTLKRLGLHVPGWQHANDAARHAVLTLRKELG